MRTLFALRTRLAALTAVALAALCTLAAHPAQAQSDSGSYGPIVAIVTPEYNQVLKGLESIVISISPRRYPAQTIELLVDGKSITGAIPAQTKFKWDTKLFIDGPHSLSVRVTDTQGFIGQAETSVLINNSNIRTESSAPILSWGGVQNGENLSGTAKVRLSTGSDFGIKYVFLNVNSAIAPDIKPPLASWMTNRPPYEFSLDTTRFKDGLYVLDAYAWDAMDNERLAPRLTIGFYNHGLNATNLQGDLPATDNAVNTAQTTSPSTSGNTSTSNTGTRTASAASSPAATLPPSSAELIKTPGTYTITTRNGWTGSDPAPSEVQSSATSQHATTTASARISDPTHFADSTRIAATASVADPDTVAVSKRPAASTPPGISFAGAQASAGDTPVTISAAASTSEMTAQGSVALARVSEPAPIARELPTISGTRTASAASLGRTDSQPRVTLAGQPGNAPIATTSTSALGTEATNNNSTVAKISEPTRIARALPEAPATATAAPEVRWAAPSRPKTAEPGPAVTSFAPQQTPISVVAGNRGESLAPDSVRSASASRLTEPRMAALPSSSLPGAPAAAARSYGKASLSMVESGSVNSQVAMTSLATPLRIASTPALPTSPRLAFLPSFKQSGSAANTAEGAAIVVSPISAQPAIYVSQRDETLAAIAMRYKVPVATLANLNDLPRNARIKQGETLALPQAIQIAYNGQAVTGDVAPFLIGSTSVAPFRFMFEKQGGKLEWDAVNHRVIARNGDHEVTINIGSNVALVNQEEVMMDMAAFLLSGRTMVPVRFFEKAMQAKVEWEPTTGRIYVAMTP